MTARENVMPRFYPQNIDFARRKAKKLKAADEGRALTACQHAYAVMTGYSSWAELVTTIKRGHHAASPLDEEVGTDERNRRENYQADRLAVVFSIPLGEALSLVQSVRPMGSASASSRQSYDRAANFGAPTNQNIPSEVNNSVMDEIYAAVRKPIIEEEQRRLLDVAAKMPTVTDEDRFSKAIFLNMVDKKMGVMRDGVGSEDYAYRLDQVVRRFLKICLDSKDLNSAWVMLTDIAYDFHIAGKPTDEHICYDAMNVIENSFRTELGIEVKVESPEERATRYLKRSIGIY